MDYLFRGQVKFRTIMQEDIVRNQRENPPCICGLFNQGRIINLGSFNNPILTEFYVKNAENNTIEV